MIQSGASDVFSELKTHILQCDKNAKIEEKLIRENAIDYSVPCTIADTNYYYSFFRGLVESNDYIRIAMKY